jgi:erythronate-4-phosphate dehydrogenase
MDADAMLIRTRTKCNEELLHETNVRFIGTATIGFDHIDTSYCDSSMISWTNAPGCNSSSVQQYITSALLQVAADYNFSLKGKTIGIVGAGNVGSKVARIARILGMNVLINDPPRARREKDNDFTDIGTILDQSDVLTVHVPLNLDGEDKTYHLFNESSFKKMKSGAWFFNSSRGEVVETASLRNVLRGDIIARAVIDVWENEPDIDQDLMEKVHIATPHIAGYSTDGKANGTSMVVESLCKFFSIPLKNWYPDNVPHPLTPDIIIDGRGKTEEDVIREAVLHSYNIKEDDRKFRSSPVFFEKQRGDYPLRREFPSYSVRLLNCTEDALFVLGEMGFNIS